MDRMGFIALAFSMLDRGGIRKVQAEFDEYRVTIERKDSENDGSLRKEVLCEQEREMFGIE